jgi:hypothetical protein
MIQQVIIIVLHAILHAKIAMETQVKTAHPATLHSSYYKIYNNALFLRLAPLDSGLMVTRIVGHAILIALSVMEAISSNAQHVLKENSRLIKSRDVSLFVLLDFTEI